MIYFTTKQLANIALLRMSPESLPFHQQALVGVLVVSFLWRFVGILGLAGPVWGAIIAIVPMILMAVLLHMLLKIRSQEERFFKLYFALQGTAVLVGMLSWCVYQLLGQVLTEMSIYSLASMWQWLIVGHVFQHGCNLTKFQGIGVGFLFMAAVMFFSLPVFVMLSQLVTPLA